MNKTELLADIAAKAYNGWYKLTTGQTVVGDDAVGITEYVANYLENVGGTWTKRNIGFYVYDEGGASEEAFYRDQPRQKDTARDSLITYIESIAGVVRFKLGAVDEDEKHATANVYTTKDVAGADLPVNQIRQATLFIWTDAGLGALQHREVV